MVRAKFRVDSITRRQGSRPVVDGSGRKWEPCEIRDVAMSPVSSSDPNSENAKFWNASPAGKIEIACANLEAAQAFELGRDYYVDFTPAPVKQEA